MIDEHQVRERAYYIWEDEGRSFGRAEAHWLRAEAEFRAHGETLLTVRPVAETSLAPSPAKALKPATSRAKGSVAKASIAKAPLAKAVAPKVAGKAAKPAAPKAVVRAKKAPGASAGGIALH